MRRACWIIELSRWEATGESKPRSSHSTVSWIALVLCSARRQAVNVSSIVSVDWSTLLGSDTGGWSSTSLLR